MGCVTMTLTSPAPHQQVCRSSDDDAADAGVTSIPGGALPRWEVLLMWQVRMPLLFSSTTALRMRPFFWSSSPDDVVHLDALIIVKQRGSGYLVEILVLQG